MNHQKGNNNQRVIIISFSDNPKQRSNKRQYYFLINPFLINNNTIVINESYLLTISLNNEIIAKFPAFARKKGIKSSKKDLDVEKSRSPQYYFNIPPKCFRNRKLLLEIVYFIEIYKNNK